MDDKAVVFTIVTEIPDVATRLKNGHYEDLITLPRWDKRSNDGWYEFVDDITVQLITNLAVTNFYAEGILKFFEQQVSSQSDLTREDLDFLHLVYSQIVIFVQTVYEVNLERGENGN